MITLDTRDLNEAAVRSEDDRSAVDRNAWRFVGAGLEFCVTVTALTLLGVWLDGRLDSSPMLTIALACVAFVVASWHLVRNVTHPTRPWSGPDHSS